MSDEKKATGEAQGSQAATTQPAGAPPGVPAAATHGSGKPKASDAAKAQHHTPNAKPAPKAQAKADAPKRDPRCVTRHVVNCACTGEMRGRIERKPKKR